MSDFANWLLVLIKYLFTAVWDFLVDIVVELVDLILTAFLALISAIPVPSFASGGLGSILAGIPSDVWFFAGNFRLAECFAILGAAMSFRLARKVLTLFQW
ncbi:hypothetical protein [Azonexus sp.]|jgi:hypothetical protein|uniref:hypothetical protein n=1 Tax=Azonexus sp. TaxID=1872668 RepID=UPI0028377598|nr:hypothetical protein [Azonexus sp.]MDR1996480.1 hypothetical protein [Azonexus sp.]